MMGAIAVPQNVSPMPILVPMTQDSTIVRIPNAGENDGSLSCDASLCDGSQIGDGTCQVDCWTPECGWDSNQSGVSDCSCEELNAALGEPGFEFVADCNGQCYYGFFFDRWMGDGFCDQGEYGLSLNCEAHQFDQGDCE